MTDREKIIKAIEICYTVGHNCTECPLFNEDDCNDRLMRDALALLREQEPVEPKVSEWLEDSDPGQEYGTTWACRKCMHSIHEPYIWNPYNSGYKYCFHCGARMEVRLDA